MSPTDEQRFEHAARSWTEHVRAGGSTPWMRWIDSPAGALGSPADALAPGAPLPGAAQLEFVRRLGERAGPGTDFPRLAERVFARSGPGRGMGHLPLLWPSHDEPPHDEPPHDEPRDEPLERASRAFGAPPVDPSRIPAEELIRIGTGVLADLLLEAPEKQPAARSARRWPWRRRQARVGVQPQPEPEPEPQFYLAGAPTTVAVVRAALQTTGSSEDARPPQALVFAAPFDQLLAQVWSARVQRGAHVRWPAFVDKWAHRRTLPPSADLPRIARRWASLVGQENVHVVVTDDGRAARRTASAVLGLPAEDDSTPAEVSDLSPAGVDLVRRMNRVLDVRVVAQRRRILTRRLVSLLDDQAQTRLVVAGRHQEWAHARAEQVAEQLRAGGYAVHGDLDQMVSGLSGTTVDRPRRRQVLALSLDACLRAVER